MYSLAVIKLCFLISQAAFRKNVIKNLFILFFSQFAVSLHYIYLKTHYDNARKKTKPHSKVASKRTEPYIPVADKDDAWCDSERHALSYQS